MLSGETATGTDPVNVIATMARLCARADANFDVENWTRMVTRLIVEDPDSGHGHDRRITDTMTDAAWRVAQELGAKAILCLTRTGFTVRAIARYRPRTPILGFTPDERVRQQLSISWGATPLPLSAFTDNDEMVLDALQAARDAGHVRPGDLVVVLAANNGRSTTTDVLRVIRVT
jgi:pyruvate kinase